MNVTAYRTSVFKENQDLPAFIAKHVPQLKDGDILVVSSKLICLWLGLTVPYKSKSQKEELIVQESDAALKTQLAWLTLKGGMVMTNAGIDESNADGKLLLMPHDLYVCAGYLRKALLAHYHLKKLGVIITDSMILPLRAGVIGAAAAYAGFKGVRDERGKKDIFGKKLEVTFVNLADALAAAAAVNMGERNERKPLCRIEGAPVQFTSKVNPKEIVYPPQQDLYAPLFKAVGLTGEKNEKHHK